MKTTDETPVYIGGKLVGWALSANGEFKPAPGWMVVNEHIVPASSVKETQNGKGKSCHNGSLPRTRARHSRSSDATSGRDLTRVRPA
jgi:hypothetical protein